MRLRSYKVPAWADRLIKDICIEERIREPRVVWMKRKDRYESSGHANAYELRLVEGANRKAAKEVLLHEMVHVIQGRVGGFGDSRYGHGAEFYAKLFEVGKRYRMGAAYIKQRETWYKPRGVKNGYRLYLKRLRESQ